MIDMNKLGARIIETRQLQGLTQEDLGEKLGVSAQAVSKWERGLSLPDTAILPDISRILKISLDALLEAETPEATAARLRETAKSSEWVKGNYEPFINGNGGFDEIVVSIGMDLFRFDGVRVAFDRMLEGVPILRKRIYRDRGVVLPVIRLRDEPGLGAEAVILLRGKPVWREVFDEKRDYTGDRVFWETQVGQGLYLQLSETPRSDWSGYKPPAEKPDTDNTPMVFFGYHVLRALHVAVTERLALFNTLDHTARILEAARVHYPALAETVIGVYGLPDLQSVFDILLAEDGSLRGLLGILEALLEYRTAYPDGNTFNAAVFVKKRFAEA